MNPPHSFSKLTGQWFLVYLCLFVLAPIKLIQPPPSYSVFTDSLDGREKVNTPKTIAKFSDHRSLNWVDDPVEDNSSVSKGLQRFVEEVFTGEKGVIRGVFVEGVFAYPIIQQPPNNDIYVSAQADLVTQFRQADYNGVTGLLAHNYLSGKDFFNLDVGQDIWIVYGNRELKHYQVTSTHSFQKIEPSNLYSQLIDLYSEKEFTSQEVYNQFYRGDPHLVLQTCLAGEGRLDWGFFFVIAKPVR